MPPQTSFVIGVKYQRNSLIKLLNNSKIRTLTLKPGGPRFPGAP